MLTTAANYWSSSELTKASVVAYAVPISIWSLGAIEGVAHTAFYFLKCLYDTTTFRNTEDSWNYFAWNATMVISCLGRVAVSAIPIFGTYLGIRTFQAEFYARDARATSYAATIPRIPHLHEVFAKCIHLVRKSFERFPTAASGDLFGSIQVEMHAIWGESILNAYFSLATLAKAYELVAEKLLPPVELRNLSRKQSPTSMSAI